MKRWIVILISIIAVVVLFHFLVARGKAGGLGKVSKCSDVTRFAPSGPVERNDQPVGGQVYVTPKEGECK